MKYTFRNRWAVLLMVSAVIALFAAILVPVAQAQIPVSGLNTGIATARVYPLTNATTFTVAGGGTNLATASVTLINSQPFPIRPGRGFSFNLEFVGTNSGTAAVTPYFQTATPTLNGGTLTTNWSQYIAGTAGAQNGTTRVYHYGIVPPTTVDNAQIARLVAVSNAHSASITLSSTNTYVTVLP